MRFLEKHRGGIFLNLYIRHSLLWLCMLTWAGAFFATDVFSSPPDLTELVKFTAGADAGDDAFGWAVATNGSWLFVGSPDEDPKGGQSGAVFVFKRGVDGWEYYETLSASDGRSSEQFGYSLAVQGDYLVVGARGNDSYQGAVYLFRHITLEGWEESDIITPTVRQGAQLFGSSVSFISDTVDDYTLVVGSPGYDVGEPPVTDAGAVYVFTGPVDELVQAAILTTSDGAQSDEFGHSVSVSGIRVVAGAPLDDQGDPDMGAAYLFHRPISGWADATEDEKLIGSDTAWGDRFGSSVSIDQTTLAVGAPNVDRLEDGYFDIGAVYIFEYESDAWHEKARLTGSEDSHRAGLGGAVVVAGEQVVAGAKSTSSEGGSLNGGFNNDGTVLVFDKPENGWISSTQTTRLGVTDPANTANLGASVAQTNGVLVAGRPGFGLEAVYLYDSLPPIVTSLDRSPSGGVLIDTFFTLSAVAKETGRGGSDITGAEYQVNGGDWLPMQARDGAYDEAFEYIDATVDVTGLPEETHEVCVRASALAGSQVQISAPVCEPFAIKLEIDSNLSVYCHHTPIWPQPGETVSILMNAMAEDERGQLSATDPIDRMDIWVDDTSEPVAFASDATVVTHTTGPLEAGSFYYGCRGTDGVNLTFTGWRRVSVGLPEGDGAIPISVTGPPEERVDVVFIPDVDSYTGSDSPAFIQAVAAMVNQGFSQAHIYNRYQHQFNFWLSRNTAEVGRSDDTSEAERILEPPEDWYENYTFADVGGVIHTDAFRDFARNGFFTVESGKTRTVRHEAGHRPFGLADEYSGDVITNEASFLPNVYESLEACEADTSDLGRVPEDCREFESTHLERSFFTSEPDSNDLMNDNSKANAADLRRIEWMFEKCTEKEC